MHTYQPLLEALEDRLLPSVFVGPKDIHYGPGRFKRTEVASVAIQMNGQTGTSFTVPAGQSVTFTAVTLNAKGNPVVLTDFFYAVWTSSSFGALSWQGADSGLSVQTIPLTVPGTYQVAVSLIETGGDSYSSGTISVTVT